MSNLTILTLNVRGLGSHNKHKLVYQFLRKHKVDVAMLQETHITDKNIDLVTNEWGGIWLNSPGTSNARGVSILINRKLKNSSEINNVKTDQSGCIIMSQLKIEEREFFLCNIYGTNEDRPEQFDPLVANLQKYPVNNIVIGGDFNFVMDSTFDSLNRAISQEKSLSALNKITNETELSDIWRIRNPEIKRYTWYKTKLTRIFSRLDWILTNNELQSCVNTCEIVSCTLTDHSGVKLELSFEDMKQGPGVWKLNNLHLNSPEFKRLIKSTIERTEIEANHCDPFEKWEHIKSECIRSCKQFSKRTAKTSKQRGEELDKVLKILKEDLTQEGPSEFIKDVELAIEKIETEITEREQKKVNSAIFRSKAKYTLEGEKGTKYFFSLEKRKYYTKNMRALYDKTGRIVTGQKSILSELNRFYKELYTANKEVVFNLHPTDSERILSQAESKSLEHNITIEEIQKVLYQMPNNKCPGIDGLTKEFYVTFFEQLGPILLSTYNHAFKVQIMNPTARKGLISLLPKKGKNLLEPKSWHALTMLCIDFKILSKTMAERLKQVLPLIISKDQCGFMKGKQISECLRKNYENIHYTKRNKIPALIMSIDFYKCFDLIEYSAIEGSLKYFNFGKNFIRWVMLFFKEFTVQTQNMGFVSQPFYKTRSVNQDCNISPFIFLLCGEIMNRKLKENPKIQGIKIGKQETKSLVSQFADDTALFLKFEQITLEEVIKTFSHIEGNTGLTISYEKTQIYRIGSLANSDTKLYTNKPIIWTNKPFTLLRIEVDNAESTQNNYDKVICSLEDTVETWGKRKLTLTGKSLIVNTLCESLFVYKFSVLKDMSQNCMEKVEGILKKYLWGNKKARIAMGTLQCSKKSGGLRLFDIRKKQKAMKISWIPKILYNPFFKKRFFENIQLPQNAFIFESILKTKDVGTYCSRKEFWGQVFHYWCEYSHINVTAKEEVLKQNIWFNSYIRTCNKPLDLPKWYKKGVIKIEQIWEDNDFIKITDTSDKYQIKTNWLEYESLKKAIPREWIEILRHHQVNDEEYLTKLERLENTNKVTGSVYKELIINENMLCKYSQKWEKEYELIIDYDEYAKAFNKINRMTESVKRRDFQYRLLLNKIPTGVELCKWKLIDTPNCTFCNNVAEDLKHLLIECRFVSRLWKWYCELVGTDIEVINLINLVYNKVHNKYEHVQNTILLTIKQYIYRKRCFQKKPSINELRKEIQTLYYIEKYSYNCKLKSHAFTKKWSSVNLLLLF